MAVVSVLLGGVVGFFSFLLSYFLLDITLLWALGVYCAVGTTVAMLAISSAYIATLRFGPTASLSPLKS